MNKKIKLFSLFLIMMILTQAACTAIPHESNSNNGDNKDSNDVTDNNNVTDSNATDNNTVKEYQGPQIIGLIYEHVSYHGGATDNNALNFSENRFTYTGYYPPSIDKNNPDRIYNFDFTDEDEKRFMDICYTNGLFDLKETYSTDKTVADGGGWTLTIEYEDGTKKISKGVNAGPYEIFNNCATVFYDLCGRTVLGILPQYYLSPPNISWGFEYCPEENHIYSSNVLARPQKANYKWNKSEITDCDIFALNETEKQKNSFDARYTYKLVLYTSNYDYDEKFTKLTVKQYDYNEDMTNEKLVFDGGWIKQLELEIELNKIYVYEMIYENGHYVQYTFSTYCPDKLPSNVQN